MLKIEELTTEQKALMEVVRDEWIASALSGGSDLDEPAARKGVRFLYELAKKPQPRAVVFVDSPLTAVLAARELGAKDVTNTNWLGLGGLAGWHAYYDFFARIGLAGVHDHEGLQQIRDFVRAGVWDVLLFENVAFVSRCPVYVRKDRPTRMHCENGPAFMFRDGFCGWYLGGIAVDRRVVMEPETITVQEIQNERNAELRRILLARYGEARYLDDSGAKLLHEDNFGKLYRQELPDDEPLVMVRVLNSTPEPDGSIKPYTLRVDPELRIDGKPQKLTARNAVAWTFGMNGEDYAPAFET